MHLVVNIGANDTVNLCTEWPVDVSIFIVLFQVESLLDLIRILQPSTAIVISGPGQLAVSSLHIDVFEDAESCWLPGASVFSAQQSSLVLGEDLGSKDNVGC